MILLLEGKDVFKINSDDDDIVTVISSIAFSILILYIIGLFCC